MTATTARLDSVQNLVRDAVATVARHVPQAHGGYQSALGDVELALAISTEHFRLVRGHVVAGRTTPKHRDVSPVGAASLVTTAETLHALVAGRIGLTEAVHARTLTMAGPTRSIAAVDRALRLLLHGVVRSPDAPDLMRRLERLAETDATRSPHAPNALQPEDSL